MSLIYNGLSNLVISHGLKPLKLEKMSEKSILKALLFWKEPTFVVRSVMLESIIQSETLSRKVFIFYRSKLALRPCSISVRNSLPARNVVLQHVYVVGGRGALAGSSRPRVSRSTYNSKRPALRSELF